MTEPDAVWDKPPFHEEWWKFVKENIDESDQLIVKTETNNWSSRFDVLSVSPNETKIRSSGKKKYWISTHGSPRIGEVNSITVRDVAEYDSYGVVERVEVYK